MYYLRQFEDSNGENGGYGLFRNNLIGSSETLVTVLKTYANG